MAPKKLCYLDYLNSYEAIAKNQGLINRLLRAPIISKKKLTVKLCEQYNISSPQTTSTCRSMQIDYFKDSLKQVRSTSLPCTRVSKVSYFSLKYTFIPKFTKSNRILLRNLTSKQ